MKIGNYEFKQTCSACPEQYDVFDQNGTIVAYVRLRWGSLYAECPDVGGTEVYSVGIGHDAGCFRSGEQRRSHLMKIAERIEWYNYPITCPHCGEQYSMCLGDFDELAEVGKSVVECLECDGLFTIRDDGDGIFVYRQR